MTQIRKTGAVTRVFQVSTLALMMGLGLPAVLSLTAQDGMGLISVAHASEDGSEGGKKDDAGDHGAKGESKGKGGEKGQKDSLTKGPSSSKGDYEASGQGPRSKSGDTSTRGTRPVWAKEGVTIELGRLNVVRAPQSVRDRQLAEALASGTATPALMTVYTWSIDQFAAQLTGETSRIDAPLANLSMYQAFITALAKNPTAKSVTISSVNKETKEPVSYTFDLSGNASPTSVLGIMLGTAADKDATKIGGLNADVVSSVNLILGVSADFEKAGLSTSAVGTAAETVRSTISTVHGE